MQKKYPRILIVDEDLDLINIMRFLYSNAFNAEVKSIKDSRQALEAVRQFDPHLITTCIGMAGIDGYDLIRKIRSAGYSKLPLFVISARCYPENIERAYQLGANEYIVKPFDSTQLIRKIEVIFNERYPGLLQATPLKAEEKATVDFIKNVRRVFDVKPAVASKRMIYIETNALERIQLSAYAQIEGYDVVAAMDLLSGLSAIDTTPHCHIALVNSRLPLRDCPEQLREKTQDGEQAGWFLAQRIKQKFPECKIYITMEESASLPEMDSDITSDIQFLVKPLPIHELADMF